MTACPLLRHQCLRPQLLPPTAHLQSYTPIGHVDAVDAGAVLQANAGLLAAISNVDWESYEAFCAPMTSHASKRRLARSRSCEFPPCDWAVQ